MANGTSLTDLSWDNTSDDTPPAKKPSGMWESFKANYLEPAIHGVATVGEGALHAVPDTIGFVGDVGYDLGQMLKDPMHGTGIPNIKMPGSGPASKAVDNSFTKAELDYLKKKGGQPSDVMPRNKGEEYANVASRGLADMLVAGGPEAAPKAALAGVSGGVAGKSVYDLTGNEDLSALASLAGGVAGGMAPEAIHGARTGLMIRRGSSHVNYPDVVKTILGLEGGGTVDHPQVSPKGATGPMQVMMETAKKPGFGIRPWDGKTQTDLVRVGKQYAAAMMDKYHGDPAKVLAAYNAGPGHVDALLKEHGADWYRHLPQETKSYVRNGLEKNFPAGRLGADFLESGREPYYHRSSIVAYQKMIDGHQALNDVVKDFNDEFGTNVDDFGDPMESVFGKSDYDPEGDIYGADDRAPQFRDNGQADEGIFPTDDHGMAYDPEHDEGPSLMDAYDDPSSPHYIPDDEIWGKDATPEELRNNKAFIERAYQMGHLREDLYMKMMDSIERHPNYEADNPHRKWTAGPAMEDPNRVNKFTVGPDFEEPKFEPKHPSVEVRNEEGRVVAYFPSLERAQKEMPGQEYWQHGKRVGLKKDVEGNKVAADKIYDDYANDKINQREMLERLAGKEPVEPRQDGLLEAAAARKAEQIQAWKKVLDTGDDYAEHAFGDHDGRFAARRSKARKAHEQKSDELSAAHEKAKADYEAKYGKEPPEWDREFSPTRRARYSEQGKFTRGSTAEEPKRSDNIRPENIDKLWERVRQAKDAYDKGTISDKEYAQAIQDWQDAKSMAGGGGKKPPEKPSVTTGGEGERPRLPAVEYYERKTGLKVGPVTLEAIHRVAEEHGVHPDDVAHMVLNEKGTALEKHPLVKEVHDLRDSMAASKMTPEEFTRYKKLPDKTPPKPLQVEIKKSPSEALYDAEPGKNKLGGLLKEGARYTEPTEPLGGGSPIRYGSAVDEEGRYFRWQERLSHDGKTWEVVRPAGATEKGFGPTDDQHNFITAKPDKWTQIKAGINHALKTIGELWHNEEGSLDLGKIFGRGKKDGEGLNGEDIGRGYAGLDPEEKLLKAVKEAKPLTSAQKRAYNAARAERAGNVDKIQQEGGGVEGYYKQLGALKGSLPKVDFQSFAKHFTEDDFNTLFHKITASNYLMPLEKVSAQTALLKLLGAEGAKVPSPSELRLLGEVFKPDLVETLSKNRPLAEKLWNNTLSALNIPRTMMASFDLSAPLRQGVFLIGSKSFWTSFGTMFKVFGSEKAYNGLMQSIKDRPTYQLMRKAGLSITNHGHNLEEREEAFMSRIATKLPGVSHSERAYEGFLNKLRADTFDNLVKQYQKAGINLEHNPKALRDIAKFVNSATGRGELKAFGKDFSQAGPLLNATFFSPKLIASRVNMLSPAFYLRLDPIVRRQAIKSLLSFGAIATTVLALSKAGGADVSTDMSSSDFAKIKHGNTRYDILGGFQQYLHLAAQTYSWFAHHRTNLKDDGQKHDTLHDATVKFVENKFSPVLSFANDWAKGKDGAGNKFELKKELADRFIPLFIQDLHDVVKEQGSSGYVSSVPGLFGVGMQTYKQKPSKSKKDESGALQQPTMATDATGSNLGDLKW
jgi:hypothetical protein